MTVRLTNLWPSNSRSNWNLEMLFFEERGKPELPGEKPLGARTRTNNKLNPHLSPSPGIEPGPHWWEACVGGEFSTTAPFPPLGFGGGGVQPTGIRLREAHVGGDFDIHNGPRSEWEN